MSVELGGGSIRLRELLVHASLDSALVVDVFVSIWSDKPLGSLVVTQNHVVLVLTVGPVGFWRLVKRLAICRASVCPINCSS